MDIERLKEEIKADEGVKLADNGNHLIYLDHLGYPTVGVGHLIKETDPEYGLEVGTQIDECLLLYDDFYVLPEEAQLIIANMMFNLGRPRLSRFHKMKKAVDNRDWQEASNQMKDSKWYRQVTNRADRLCERMAKI